MVIYYSKAKVFFTLALGLLLSILGIWALWKSGPGVQIYLFGFEGEFSETGSLITRIIGFLFVLFFLKVIPYSYRAYKADWVDTKIDKNGIWSSHRVWKRTIPWDEISGYKFVNVFGERFIQLKLKKEDNDKYGKKFFGTSSALSLDLGSVKHSTEEITKELDKYIKRA